MSYHRDEPYVWSDGEHMHLWSNLREDTRYTAGVRIKERIFDEIVIKRFVDMIEEGRVPIAIAQAVRKSGGAKRFLNEMLKAARNKPDADALMGKVE